MTQAPRLAIEDQVADALARGARVDFADIDDPCAMPAGPVRDEAVAFLEMARAETRAALDQGLPNPNLGLTDPRFMCGPEWMALRKSALALHPLYSAGRWPRLGAGVTAADLHRPFPWGQAPADELVRQLGQNRAQRAIDRYERFLVTPYAGCLPAFMRATADAAAIRTRAIAASRSILEQSARWSTGEPIRLASLACGAAGPVAELVGDLLQAGCNVEQLTLLDRDPFALAVGRAVAEHAGHSVEVRPVLHDLVDLPNLRAASLTGALDSNQSVVEMLGLFEYLPDFLATDLLRRVREIVAPDGLIVFANMLQPRPFQDVFSDVIQWPAVLQRSIDRVLDLIVEAGFAAEQTTMLIPERELIYQVVLIDAAL